MKLKPIRIIVPYAAGGNTYSIAQITAHWLSRDLRVPIYVEARPGATGATACDYVASSKFDGDTLFMATSSQWAIQPMMWEFDPIKDWEFTPVAMVARNRLAMVLNENSIKARTLNNLVAYVKKHPGKVRYASGGYCSVGHLTMELFLKKAKLQMEHVAYDGDVPAMEAVVNGGVPVYFGNVSEANRAKRQNIKVLAVSGNEPVLKDVPTAVQADTLNGLFARAGTPSETIEQIADAISVATRPGPASKSGLTSELKRIGVDALGKIGKDFANLLENDKKDWSQRLAQL